MTAPLWLRDKGVQQLLNSLVDRLDRADAQGKTSLRALKLDGKSFPALYRAELESDREQLWSYIQNLAKLRWISVKLDTALAGQAAYERNPRVEVLDVKCVREAVGRTERVKSAGELWREAVFSILDAQQETKEAVSRFLVEIPGRLALEIVERLNELPQLANDPLLLREVSAKLFWGQSKVLDNRQGLVAVLLGADECPFPETPVQLQVFLPSETFEGVLFIENQATFEIATRDNTSRFNGLALVFASGFKGSAKRLRLEAGVSLYFAEHGTLDESPRQKFKQWLFKQSHLPSWFWGDLDYAGMGILKSLRASFDGLSAWKPGYALMVESLKDGRGHVPAQAGKAAQRLVEVTGCLYADSELIPYIRLYGQFVDQEAV